jgi:hypothetical protein
VPKGRSSFLAAARKSRKKGLIPLFFVPLAGIPGGSGGSHTPLAVAPEPGIWCCCHRGWLESTGWRASRGGSDKCEVSQNLGPSDVLLTVWLYSSLLMHLAQQWWQDPNYTHGFFVPVFSLFLNWENRARLAALPMKPSWWGLVGYPDIRADGVGAGNNHFRLLPLPRIPSTLDLWDGRVSCGMETSGGDFLSAGVSDFHDPFVDPGGPDHLSTPDSGFHDCFFPINRDWGSGYPSGNIILLPNARLEVAEACSGIRSLFSLITLTVIYGYLASGVTQKRPMRVTSKPANENEARGR